MAGRGLHLLTRRMMIKTREREEENDLWLGGVLCLFRIYGHAQ